VNHFPLPPKALLAILIGLGCLAACGSSTSPAPTNAGSSTLSVATTTLGPVLVDSSGYTLYYFLPQRGGVASACDSTCLATWPPLPASSSQTKTAALPGSLGAIVIPGGQREVTYNGWPLHRYSGDSAPGQTNGNGILNMWFAATPSTTATATSPVSPRPHPALTPTPNPYNY
jgi:predicted lipoprotein with Yx(FWY)xxD motif